MRTRQIHSLLLFLALVLGQWVSIAHASEHAAPQAHSALCDYCVSGIGSGPASAPPALPVFAHDADPLPVRPVLPVVTAKRYNPRLSQGPPLHS